MSEVNFEMIGLHPDNAVKIVLDLYDDKSTPEEKIKLLMNNRPLEALKSRTTDERFISGKTIDINAGELLGLGLVGEFYNWTGQASGDTYQAAVGLEDSAKTQEENFLSDGAIWHDQKREKMLFQQVMVQGFFPKKRITTDSIVEGIEHKIAVRYRYPEHCGLIVNTYANEGIISFAEIPFRVDVTKFDAVFVVIYILPDLKFARVTLLEPQKQPSLAFALKRYPHGNVWEFNYDASKRKTSQ